MDYDRLYVDLFCGNTDITHYRVRKYISTVELKSREVKKVFWYSSLSRYTPTKAKSGQRDKHFFPPKNVISVLKAQVKHFNDNSQWSHFTICDRMVYLKKMFKFSQRKSLVDFIPFAVLCLRWSCQRRCYVHKSLSLCCFHFQKSKIKGLSKGKLQFCIRKWKTLPV